MTAPTRRPEEYLYTPLGLAESMTVNRHIVLALIDFSPSPAYDSRAGESQYLGEQQ